MPKQKKTKKKLAYIVLSSSHLLFQSYDSEKLMKITFFSFQHSYLRLTYPNFINLINNAKTYKTQTEIGSILSTFLRYDP